MCLAQAGVYVLVNKPRVAFISPTTDVSITFDKAVPGNSCYKFLLLAVWSVNISRASRPGDL